MCIKLFCKLSPCKLHVYDMKWPVFKFWRVNGKVIWNSVYLSLCLVLSFFSSSLISQIKKTERVEIIKFKMTRSWFLSDVINDVRLRCRFVRSLLLTRSGNAKAKFRWTCLDVQLKILLTSSNSTTALGHSLSFLVSCPPWSWPMYPGGAPIIFAT